MKIDKPTRSRWMALIPLLVCVMALGCMNFGQPPVSAIGAGQGTGEATTAGKSGAELWANNCVRCHNFRSPASYSDAQWEVAMMHMRVRANLTAEELKAILEFLKSGN